MDIHIMKPENQILIVDEKEFYRIKKKAEMTDSEIEAMVEKHFLPKKNIKELRRVNNGKSICY